MKKILKKTAKKHRKLIVDFLLFFYSEDISVSKHFNYGTEGIRWLLRDLWQRKILRLGRNYPFPVALNCTISDPSKLVFDMDDLNNFQSPGTYFQNFEGNIFLGKGCYIAPNVGIITSNHDLKDLSSHSEAQDVVIGNRCWVGMNSVILPGVTLGPNTIVGAGAVVTKSFLDGYVVLAGNPAKIIKKLER